jgi:hypothetical protein
MAVNLALSSFLELPVRFGVDLLAQLGFCFPHGRGEQARKLKRHQEKSRLKKYRFAVAGV